MAPKEMPYWAAWVGLVYLEWLGLDESIAGQPHDNILPGTPPTKIVEWMLMPIPFFHKESNYGTLYPNTK